MQEKGNIIEMGIIPSLDGLNLGVLDRDGKGYKSIGLKKDSQNSLTPYNTFKLDLLRFLKAIDRVEKESGYVNLNIYINLESSEVGLELESKSNREMLINFDITQRSYYKSYCVNIQDLKRSILQ